MVLILIRDELRFECNIRIVKIIIEKELVFRGYVVFIEVFIEDSISWIGNEYLLISFDLKLICLLLLILDDFLSLSEKKILFTVD